MNSFQERYPIPCVYSGEPKPLTNVTLSDQLKQLTPELFTGFIL
jgi:hypothetical protein